MEPEPKVEFSDTKLSDAKPRSSRKTKIAAIGVLTVVLLLGAVVSVAAFFILRKSAPTRLAEVNLEQGETLTYRVHQDIELQGGYVRKDEYWFLMKFNLSHVGGNMDIKSVNIITEYFLVRLQIASRTPNQANKETGESFEVYGYLHTNEELIRHIYGILDQLLPTLKRDLYEDVDGVKVTESQAVNPEDSPLLPGSVKMHREANTSDKDALLIKNHFDRADFLNMSSDIDLDLEYSDFAFINKSNGMVTESHAYFSEQLNFGEQIHFEGGDGASVMKITLTSHVSLIESNSIYFGYVEAEAVNFHFFVKLVVPKSKPTFSVNRHPQRSAPSTSKTGQRSSNALFPANSTITQPTRQSSL
ncbi:hypothetical protein OS493_033447 [Desmophyllum pertusum]|uniref:Uncharacterized protein n=1 Tax=Desmophyllum pertusum TaxID=174260 RepID=A0A9W9ZX68_9CNID|nr:hypothetical protein OS493_033447 [Desmophyllum pertusum]